MGRTSAVSGDASKSATWSYPSSHCQVERLCLQLCNATTERERRRHREKDINCYNQILQFFNYSETSSFRASCCPGVLQQSPQSEITELILFSLMSK